MSKLRNRIEALQNNTSSTAVLDACNEAIRRIVSSAENPTMEANILEGLLENLSKIDDESAKQFVSTNVIEKRVSDLNNLGVKTTFATIGKSEIAKHPGFSYMFEKLKSLESQPEWLVIENVITALTPFRWDSIVNECLQNLVKNSDKFREEITIYSIVENIKRSTSNYLLPAISVQLETYLDSRSTSDRIKLMEKSSQFLFDSNMKKLYSYLSEAERSFHISATDNSCTINPVYSPVSLSESCEYFVAGGSIYKKFQDTINLVSEEEAQSFPTTFRAIADILTWNNVAVSEGLVKIYSGDKVIEITESAVKINGKPVSTDDIHKVYLNAGVFRMNERKDIDATFIIRENWHSIFEMDFAKTITSKAEPHKSMTVFFLNENIFINKSNAILKESIFYNNCNATQAKNLVLEYMKTDISSTFTQLLNEDELHLKESARLKAEFIQAIGYLTEQREKLERIIAIQENAELRELIVGIDEEIDMLKAEYSKVSVAERSTTHVDEGVKAGDEAMLGKKK